MVHHDVFQLESPAKDILQIDAFYSLKFENWLFDHGGNPFMKAKLCYLPPLKGGALNQSCGCEGKFNHKLKTTIQSIDQGFVPQI